VECCEGGRGGPRRSSPRSKKGRCKGDPPHHHLPLRPHPHPPPAAGEGRPPAAAAAGEGLPPGAATARAAAAAGAAGHPQWPPGGEEVEPRPLRLREEVG